MTGPVRPPSPRDQAWAELAAELAPAKSLARIDVVTARSVATVTVVGVLLTGLGAASTALPGWPGTARALAAAAVITAALAVAAALAAQVLTINRHLNPANLTEVKAWYRRQFEFRAYPAQAATILLLAAALLAGAAAATGLTASPTGIPALTIIQAPGPGGIAAAQQGTVTVSVAFGGLAAGQPATVILTTPGTARVLGRAVATAGPDGTAAVTLTAQLSVSQTAVVTATGPLRTCQAILGPAAAGPALTCHAR